MTIHKYIELKQYIYCLTYKRKNGKGFYLQGEHWIPEDIFQLPVLPLFVTGSDIAYDNADHTKHYLHSD